MKRLYVYLLGVLFLFTSPLMAQTSSSSVEGLGMGFGGSSAVGSGEMFIGSAPVGWPRGDEPAGIVYRYERDAEGAWVEAGRLMASDQGLGDNFGRSISLLGDVLAVGAPGNGAVYLFKRNEGGEWVETAKLAPEDMMTGAEFGGANDRGGSRVQAIALSGAYVFVTAYHADSSTGAVHVFKGNEGGYEQVGVLTPEDGAEEDNFGGAIVADERHLFVSAARGDELKGLVYVFELNDAGEWQEQQTVSAEVLEARSGFGASLAVNQNRLFVGAPNFNRTGGVFVFGKDAQTGIWSEDAKLVPHTTRNSRGFGGGFGLRLAAAGSNLAISSGSGEVTINQQSSLGGRSVQVLRASGMRNQPGFGIGLAMNESVVVIGSPRADYEEGLATVFERKEEYGEWTETSQLASEVATYTSIFDEQVDCEDGKAALFDCNKVDLISFMSLEDLSSERGVKMTDIWGWEDPDTGKEWVLQARTNGVSFVDISNPLRPVYVGQLMKTEGSPGSAWRDVKVYKNHAFIVADGAAAHGVQIFDLTQLRDVDPADMPVTFDETAHYDGVHSTHNIVINEETGYAYAVGNRAGGETCGGQLHMIDIREPQNPKFAGCFHNTSGGLAFSGGTHDSQCVTYRGPDIDYVGREICLNSNGSSFIIADVTDKEDPKTLSFVTYPDLAYTHQGWLTEDQRYFYMNDELDEMYGHVDGTRTLIWDVADLEDPLLVNEFRLNNKASDHNLYVRGNFMYQSNYQAGLRILDISDPENPVEVAHFDTVPLGEDQPGFGGSWSNYPYFKSGIIAVSSRGEGLFLVKKQDIDI